MATDTSNQREKQEQSIKARKHELFVGEADVSSGPRRKFRQVLKDTPAAPLSKNVKLILWGSAAPVVLVFFAALLTNPQGSKAKAPEGSVIPVHRPPPVQVAKRSVDQPPAPGAEGAKPESNDGAKADKPPEEKKEKPKGKGKGKGKSKSTPKPEDETTVAQAAERERERAEKPEEDKDGETKKKPKPDAESSEDADKPAANPKDKGKSAANGNDKGKSANAKDTDKGKPATPAKPKRAPMFKKPKPPVFTYPKANRDGDKKGEPKTEPAPDSTP